MSAENEERRSRGRMEEPTAVISRSQRLPATTPTTDNCGSRFGLSLKFCRSTNVGSSLLRVPSCVSTVKQMAQNRGLRMVIWKMEL